MNIKELKNKCIGFVSFGCGKNIVELEKMISAIKNFGFKIAAKEEDANVIIINSCAFLKSTRKEGFDTICDFQNLRNNNLEKIIITGCLPNYTLQDIGEHIVGADLLLTQDKNSNIVREIANLYGVKTSCKYDGYSRILTTPSHYAYFRIADGCNNFCSYCTIPYITGRYKSVPIESLLKEAQGLANQGVTELIFVAQDITTYGIDLYGKTCLVELVQKISLIDSIKRIRLIYCYPEHITKEIINEIKTNSKVCKYIDIPLQHISNSILKKMNRQNTKENTIKLISILRKEIPNIQIRTTFILGFPTETEEDFNELYEFISKTKLNQVGFFAYSREKGTIAYSLKPQISQKLKNERVKKLASLQFENVKINNEKLIGRVFNAVVDNSYDNFSILRTEFQLPDLDNVTIVKDGNLKVGSYHNVRIIETDNYDLVAELLD